MLQSAKMVLGSALELIASSPVALLATAAAAVVALVVIRILANTFHGSRPPIFEGIPFVGGLMKFAGVSANVLVQRQQQACSLHTGLLQTQTHLHPPTHTHTHRAPGS